MEIASEIAIVNFLSSNANVIDLQNFVTLGSYKNCNGKKNKVSLIKNDIILLADTAKPMLRVFDINKWEENTSSRIILPNRPNAICTSNDGCFCVIAIENDLLIWQPASNAFIKNPHKVHYQQITVVRFNITGSFFISGGADGLIVVWHLSKVLSDDEQINKSSYTVFSDHQLPITDVNLSTTTSTTYLLSTSMDKTCRVIDLNAKCTILKIIFESVLTVGLFGIEKNYAMLGSSTGAIYKVDFSASLDACIEENSKGIHKFPLVHNKEVSCMAIRDVLISGGLDKLIVVWNLNGQALHILPQNSEVTNINIIKYLKKNNTGKNNQIRPVHQKSDHVELYCPKQQINTADFFVKQQATQVFSNNLEHENARLRHINKEIYEYCKKLILSDE